MLLLHQAPGQVLPTEVRVTQLHALPQHLRGAVQGVQAQAAADHIAEDLPIVAVLPAAVAVHPAIQADLRRAHLDLLPHPHQEAEDNS